MKLEFGARGDNKPNKAEVISPYLYSILPQLFEIPSITVQALTAERTFWEKVTLLHEEFHRKPEKPLKVRMFRHYYDLVMLHKNGISFQALNDLDLLDIVLMNKKIYFASASANYEAAKIGTLRLMPNQSSIGDLRKDCKNMSDMFFGQAPDFDEIIYQVEEIERLINS